PTPRLEGQPAHRRVQAVGPNHEIELAMATVLECYVYEGGTLVYGNDFVTEYNFRVASTLFEEQPGKCAPRYGDIASARQLLKHPSSESRDTSTVVVNDAHLLHVIAALFDCTCETHALGDVGSCPNPWCS